MKDIVIIGAGGFGREVAWLIQEINLKKLEWNLLGFVSDNQDIVGESFNGVEVLGTIDYLADREVYVVIAIGNSVVRKKIKEKIGKYRIKYANLIHPEVLMSNYVEIGYGNIICAGNIITTNIHIGNHCIINLSSTIGHDAVIEDFVTILPGCHISGKVILRECAEIGTGTQIIQNVEVGQNTIVGAGATVTRNLPANCTAVGMPARPIKYH